MVGCLMTTFKRGLRPDALAALRAMTDSSKPNWWKDLLALWAPSGVDSGDESDPKLRVAVRNNYLNFYRSGQSVARVCFGPRVNQEVEPRLETHVYYAFEKRGVQAYAKLAASDSTLTDPTDESRSIKYNGVATLRSWIGNADPKSGAEKRSIDRVISNNPSVIDVEMAISDGKIASRIDLVDLEAALSGFRIALWEGKLYSDTRLRSNGDFPKIKSQLEIYRKYCSDEHNRIDIIDSYKRSCRVLVELADMANSCGNSSSPLDPAIFAVSDGSAELAIDPMPRLLIFDGMKDKEPIARVSGWEPHRDKLTKHGITIKECEDWKLR